MSFDNNLEGFNATRNMWFRFWNPAQGNFATSVPCHESHGSQFSCYAQAVAIQAIGDSVKRFKDLTIPIVEPAIKSTLKYRNPKRGAYSVDFHGGINSGDDDICYDDNAHLLRGVLACYEGSGNPEYLNICHEIMNFLLTGFVDHQVWHIKGLRWHMTKKYMATISNSVSAICAMKMIPYAESEQEKAKLYEFAKICLNFIWTKMLDPNDHIIMDGVGMDSTNTNKNKFSYNTGSTLSAICELYKYDKDPQWFDKAKQLAEAATHRGKTLFDRDYDDWNKRYWNGVSYFNQLLFEGLADFIETFADKSPESTLNCCKNELKRHLSYFRKYCMDPSDNLYFMTFDIYRINPEVYKRYRTEFGGNKDYRPDPRERQKEIDSVPVDKRPVTKSLIGQAAAAHIFFEGGRIWPKMDPVPT